MKLTQHDGSFGDCGSKATCSLFHSSSAQPGRWSALAIGTVAQLAWATLLHAQPIDVPNGSFESQVAGPPLGLEFRVDSWQKSDSPAWFDPNASGFAWDQTVGLFPDSNPYTNRDGNQLAYLLSLPDVAVFQDYDTVDWSGASPTHEFNAVFEEGLGYTLTLGVFGKDMPEGATLELSLYYRDGADNMVTVGSATATYNASTFPNTPPLSLVEYAVNVPLVRATDPWMGQNIGIKIESTFGTGAGYWDIDNVRLSAVPEPAAVSLLAVGLAGLYLARGRAPRLH